MSDARTFDIVGSPDLVAALVGGSLSLRVAAVGTVTVDPTAFADRIKIMDFEVLETVAGFNPPQLREPAEEREEHFEAH